MRTCVLFSLTLITLAAARCGGGNSDNNPPPPPPPTKVSANITVSPNSTSTPFDLAMSTSFAPGGWDDQFFQRNAGGAAVLSSLLPQHVRLQTAFPNGLPQTSATTWDFSRLDALTQPVLTIGDRSPQLQLGWAPSFMWSGGNLDINQFTAYAQNLVRYYNKGGFTSPDGFHVSPANQPIQWWGILNEPIINNISSVAQYTQIYNQVVPAMQAVDPTIKFAALEMCCGTENWVQTFATNVTAQVDVLATHYYSSCNQRDTDAQIFSTVPGFAVSVQQIYAALASNPALANVPVWITENNVNSDFSDSTGHSICHPSQAFVVDRRGSSAFFAACRPYVFSQVGKAGARVLHHWAFDVDAQFGEVDLSGNPLLSYWVDYWLTRYFPGGSGQQLLNSTNSNSAQVEVLPVRNTDGSVVIMISNHAVASSTDNNGAGLTATISLNIGSLGSFSSAGILVIDSTTSPTNGPAATNLSPTSSISLTMNGYSVAFIKLVP